MFYCTHYHATLGWYPHHRQESWRQLVQRLLRQQGRDFPCSLCWAHWTTVKIIILFLSSLPNRQDYVEHWVLLTHSSETGAFKCNCLLLMLMRDYNLACHTTVDCQKNKLKSWVGVVSGCGHGVALFSHVGRCLFSFFSSFASLRLSVA